MRTSGNFQHTRPPLLDSRDNDKKAGIVFFVLSLVIHAGVLCAMVIFQDVSFPKPMPPVIQVDLVSFAPAPALETDEQPSAAATEEAVFQKPSTAPPKPEKIPHVKPDISLKTKPKNLKELVAQQKAKPEKKPEEKPAPEPQKIPEDTPVKQNPPEKKPEPEKVTAAARPSEDSAEDKIAQALSRLQQTVREQGPATAGQPEGTAAGKGRQKGLDSLTLYHLVIQSAIQQNWVYTDVFAGMDQGLEVRLLIKILASGEIRDIFYETRSGNRYLDESAKKAVMKINPLPPLPAGMPSYDLGLIFTPKGLK